MDQSEAIKKARQFARNAYAAESERILRERQDELVKMRNQMAARGMAGSGAVVTETARISGEKIKVLTEAKLNTILEGYELYGIVIDDLMAVNICDEVIQGMNQMVIAAGKHVFRGVPASAAGVYPQLVAHNVGVSAAWVKTQIDRRRLMPKKPEAPSVTTIYNVQGDHARWNVNSTDNSVNVSSTEFFTTLRKRIETGVPEGDERKLILQKLTALEEAHGQPSFAQGYTDFIAAAANHVVLLTPFIPALTEMLHKVLA